MSYLMEKIAFKVEDYPAIKHFIGDAGKKELLQAQARRKELAARRVERAARSGDSVASRIDKAKRDISSVSKSRGKAMYGRYTAAKDSVANSAKNPGISKKQIVDRAKDSVSKVKPADAYKAKVAQKYLNKVDRAVTKVAKRGLKGAAVVGGLAAAGTLANKVRNNRGN